LYTIDRPSLLHIRYNIATIQTIVFTQFGAAIHAVYKLPGNNIDFATGPA